MVYVGVSNVTTFSIDFLIFVMSSTILACLWGLVIQNWAKIIYLRDFSFVNSALEIRVRSKVGRFVNEVTVAKFWTYVSYVNTATIVNSDQWNVSQFGVGFIDYVSTYL